MMVVYSIQLSDKSIYLIIVTPGLFACNQQTGKETTQGDWIRGTETEQIKTIEKQFRGFDNAMVETGYRYQELYWVGRDQNWEYADYQLAKIKSPLKRIRTQTKKGKISRRLFELYFTGNEKNQ